MQKYINRVYDRSGGYAIAELKIKELWPTPAEVAYRRLSGKEELASPWIGTESALRSLRKEFPEVTRDELLDTLREMYENTGG